MRNEKTKLISYSAVLIALGVVLVLIEIPYFIPFLKFDLSDLPVLAAVSFLNPLSAFLIIIVKTLMLILKNESPLFIGPFMSFLASTVLCFSFYFLKKFYKKLFTFRVNYICTMISAALIIIVLMTTFTFLVAVPVYMTQKPTFFTEYLQVNNIAFGDYFWLIISTYIPFNALKMVAIALVFYPLYLSLRRFFNIVEDEAIKKKSKNNIT